MQAWGSALKRTPCALLPEGSSAIQKMENLFSLKSIVANWLRPSPTSWVIDIILAFLCGLGLFLLLLLCFQSNPSLPPPRKHRNIRKHHVELKARSRSSKKSRSLKACRDCLEELEGIHSLVSLLQSHLGRLRDKGGFHQLSCQDPPGEVCKTVPAGARQPCEESVEDAAPAMSLLAPLTKRRLPLASTISPGQMTSSVSVHSHTSLSASQSPEPFLPLDSISPQSLALSSAPSCLPDSEAGLPTASSAPPPPDSIPTLTQCNSSMALPLGTVPQSLSPHTPWSASLIPAISDLGRSSCPISTLSWWQAAAESLCLSSSSQCKSQKKHLSHNPPEASLWVGSTDRQVEAGSPSLLSSDDQNLLEIQVRKTVEIKIWKEKDGSQMSPDCHLNPLGNMLISLGTEQDTTTPQHFSSTKDKSEQLSCPQQCSYPKVLGDHLQQKYNQLFWGLPSLHSESLVATAWISESSSAPQSPSFLFNGISNACPVQTQAKISPPISQFQPLSHLEFQSQPYTLTIPQFQPPPLAQVQTQAHLKPSLPVLPPSPSQIRACGVSCPTVQNKPQSLTPTEIQHSEWSLLQNQLENGWALSSVVKRSQEVFSVFTSNLPEDNWVVSILPENFPISPELRNQLEQHLQKRLIRHGWELPQRIQESLDVRQLQGELPGTCQTKGKHGLSRPSSFRGESSKDARRVGCRLSQDLGKGLGHILGEVPKDLSRSSESCLVEFPGVNSEESESDLTLLRSDSGIDLLRSLDENLENILKGHLDKKLGQISEDLIPMDVRQSCLAVKCASLQADAHMETRNLRISKEWEPCMNTSHRLSFLDPDIREALEAHITRFWVKHRWGLPFKVLKPINLFKLKKAQPSRIWQLAFPPSATGVSRSHSTVKFAEFLGKPPQAHSRDKVIMEESVPTLVRPLLAPSPVCKPIQRDLGGIPSGDSHGPSKAPLTGQEGRPPSQSLTLSLVGRTQKSETVEWTKRDSLEPHPRSAMARNEPREESGGPASRDPFHKVQMMEVNLGSQSLRGEEAREAGEAKESPVLQPQSRVTLETKVLTKSQTTSVHMRNLEAPGTSKSSLLPRMSIFQHPGETCLNTEVASEFKSKGNVQSDNQLQDCPKQVFPAVDNLASQVPQCHPQRVPTRDRLASQAPSGLMAAQRSSPGQQEPKTSKPQDSGKSQSKMVAPTYKKEDCRQHKPGENEEGFKELETSQAGSMNNPTQVRGIKDSVGSKCLQLVPENKQSPPESLFRKRMRLFLKRIFPSKKVNGRDALQKCKPISATAQSQGSGKSRSILNSETAEAQALMTTLGQILEEKMAIHHGLHARKLKEQKQELQAPVSDAPTQMTTETDPMPHTRQAPRHVEMLGPGLEGQSGHRTSHTPGFFPEPGPASGPQFPRQPPEWAEP
ncbi:spermatogenesis-associated protein 31A6-like [Hippopotamus amphibius kiboko]|uniref:spermatogenesis-associated protein 31A6-like n=1 Tax=Hippopotamus amphibius kiboko TaxID=575201 RepID=UPI0025934CD5|nr:spermatogenesis-associated protein 31A6-like [Hippopotamus amphibius kiboko]